MKSARRIDNVFRHHEKQTWKHNCHDEVAERVTQRVLGKDLATSLNQKWKFQLLNRANNWTRDVCINTYVKRGFERAPGDLNGFVPMRASEFENALGPKMKIENARNDNSQLAEKTVQD